MTNRVPYRSGTTRPAPKKGGAAKPYRVPGSDFNSPPLAKPKPAPRQRAKPKPQAKVGPYTKPVPYKAGTKYRAGQPVRLDSGETVIANKSVTTPKASRAPASPSALLKANRLTPEQEWQAVFNRQGYFDNGKFHMNPVVPVADISAGTLSLAGLADRVSRAVVGPNLTNLVEGKSMSDPRMAPVEALGILPFGKIGKVADVAAHIVGGVKRGDEAGKIIEGATQVARQGKLPPDRFVDVGGLTVRTPAAPQRHVRQIENALDRNIARVVKRGTEKGLHPQDALAQPGIRAKVARAHAKHLTEHTGFYENKGAEGGAKALLNIPKSARRGLTDAQLVALRQLARGVHPNVELRANESRIAEAVARGDKQAVADLQADSHLLRMSRHYIEGKGTSISLRQGTGKADQRLAEVWKETQRVGQRSEAMQIKAGDLTPEIAAARKAAPGELTLARTGYEGHAGHEGGLYYPSVRDVKKFNPRQPWKTKGQILPFKPRGESKQPFAGALQERGAESYNVPQQIGRQAAARENRVMANARLAELRDVAIKGTLPTQGNLEKDFRAIRLVPTPNSDATNQYNQLLENLSKKVEVTPEEAQQATKSLIELRNELMPEVQKVLQNGQLPKEYGLVHRALLGALEDPKVFNAQEFQVWHKILMDVSTVGKDMIVYTKIGHAPPRLVSNILMALPDTGRDFVSGLLLNRKLRKVRPDLLRWIHEQMGGSYYTAVTETSAPAHKLVKGISKGLVGWIERVADRSPRNAAFTAFAIKDAGTKNMGEIIKHLEAMRAAEHGSEAFASRTRVLMHARQAAGEYERVGRDASLGNWLFLYRWLKASSVWTGRFMVKHPIQASGVGYLTSQYGYQAANPIWNHFNIAGHNVQTALPYSTPVEMGERAKAAFQQKFPALGESPLDMLHPMIPALAAGLGHVDIERGHAITGNSWKTAGTGFLHQTPPGALIAGKGDLRSRIEKFLGGNFLPTTSTPVKAKPGSFKFTKEQEKALRKAGNFKFTPAQNKALDDALKRLGR